MIIESLRHATKTAHAELDHSIFPVIQSINSVEDYASLLKNFYGFFKPMYDCLDTYLEKDILIDYHSRRKPVCILDDLFLLTGNDDDIDICLHLPIISNSPQAFGCMYVLEGSTMGGSILCKKIAENLGYSDYKCLSFFNGYGEKNHSMWTSFLQCLENSANKQQEEELINAAVGTFKSFQKWINLRYIPVQQKISQAV